MVSTKNRKMDKSAVLRCTISFLKAHNGKTGSDIYNQGIEASHWKGYYLVQASSFNGINK